jgi:hypothetical protein
MALTKIQESLMVFAALKNQIEPALRVVKRHKLEDDLKFTVTNYLLILVSSFLDEWRRFTALDSDARVSKTIQTAKPAAERIQQWPGIYELRSSALAHGFRKKDRSLVHISDLFGEGVAPSNYAEQILLAECAVYAIATAICQLQDIYRDGISQIYDSGPHHVRDCGIQTMEMFEQEIAAIRRTITSIDPNLETCFNGKQDYS